MVVYGLPWTQAIKIIHFELTWDIKDSEDTEGVRRSISFFVQNSYTMVSSLSTPLEPSNHFELTLDPIDTENAKGVQRSFCIFCSKPFWNEWVSMDSPWPKHLRFDILGWCGTRRSLRTLMVCRGPSVLFCSKPLQFGCPSTEELNIWQRVLIGMFRGFLRRAFTATQYRSYF